MGVLRFFEVQASVARSMISTHHADDFVCRHESCKVEHERPEQSLPQPRRLIAVGNRQGGGLLRLCGEWGWVVKLEWGIGVQLVGE